MSDTRVPTPETLEVKRRGRHRLIGAITLAVLAVVIIPMVLDSEPRKVGRDLPLAIPAKEGLPALPPPSPEPAKPAPEAAKTAVADVTASPAAAATTPVEKAAEKSTDRPGTKPAEKPAEPSTPVAKVADTPKADKPAKSETKADAKAEKPSTKANDKSAKLEGFAIQLGAFSDAEKLAALKAKMKTAKVPVFTETVKTSSGSLTRLRAGPYKTREQADKALAQVKKAGADGQVVPLP